MARPAGRIRNTSNCRGSSRVGSGGARNFTGRVRTLSITHGLGRVRPTRNRHEPREATWKIRAREAAKRSPRRIKHYKMALHYGPHVGIYDSSIVLPKQWPGAVGSTQPVGPLGSRVQPEDKPEKKSSAKRQEKGGR